MIAWRTDSITLARVRRVIEQARCENEVDASCLSLGYPEDAQCLTCRVRRQAGLE